MTCGLPSHPKSRSPCLKSYSCIASKRVLSVWMFFWLWCCAESTARNAETLGIGCPAAVHLRVWVCLKRCSNVASMYLQAGHNCRPRSFGPNPTGGALESAQTHKEDGAQADYCLLCSFRFSQDPERHPAFHSTAPCPFWRLPVKTTMNGSFHG